MKDTEVNSSHWTRQKEVAGFWLLKFMLFLFWLFPVVLLRLIAFPVGFFYFLFSSKARNESRRFLTKAAPYINNTKIAKKCRSRLGPLRHIISFSLTLVEKLQSWGGKFPYKNIHFQNDDIRKMVETLENGKGVILLSSHLGNIELMRGLAYFNRTKIPREIPITVIYDMHVTGNFNRMLNELNSQSLVNIINPGEIGPETAILLQEKLAAGEMAGIAGDRTSVNTDGKNLMISFLGEEAPFSAGIFYLAILLNAPVYFLLALRRKDLSLMPKYDIHIHKFALPLNCSRKERLTQSVELAHSFAALLESYCKEKPFQWYNFYDFWSKEV
jgi:predicted LPLAT superfamily acyltransferase